MTGDLQQMSTEELIALIEDARDRVAVVAEVLRTRIAERRAELSTPDPKGKRT